MSRTRKRSDLPFWTTGPQGGKTPAGQRLPFIQVSADLLQAPAFQKLPHATRLVYLSMCIEAHGQRDFEFSLSTARRYGFESSTLRRAVNELVAARFICCTENGRFTRNANRYAFLFDWKCTDNPQGQPQPP